MNATDATCGRAQRRRLNQTALPLPFAVRATWSTRPIPTGLQTTAAGDPHHGTELSHPHQTRSSPPLGR
jgi:hypothetical protein